jgi:hypothetical protein
MTALPPALHELLSIWQIEQGDFSWFTAPSCLSPYTALQRQRGSARAAILRYSISVCVSEANTIFCQVVNSENAEVSFEGTPACSPYARSPAC